MRSNRKHHKRNQLSFVLVSWVIGVILCTVMVGLFKYYGIYENVSWFKVMSIPIFGFIVIPGVFAIMVVCALQVDRWLATRPKKKPDKMTIRKRRLGKVFGLYAMCWGFLLMICIPASMVLAIYIGRLYVPEYNSEEDLLITIPLFVFFFIITTLPTGFLTTAIYARLFIKKKGKVKVMKYFFELKKPPGILKTVWLRACGINQRDIQEYLRDYVNISGTIRTKGGGQV